MGEEKEAVVQPLHGRQQEGSGQSRTWSGTVCLRTGPSVKIPTVGQMPLAGVPLVAFLCTEFPSEPKPLDSLHSIACESVDSSTPSYHFS